MFALACVLSSPTLLRTRMMRSAAAHAQASPRVSEAYGYGFFAAPRTRIRAGAWLMFRDVNECELVTAGVRELHDLERIRFKLQWPLVADAARAARHAHMQHVHVQRKNECTHACICICICAKMTSAYAYARSRLFDVDVDIRIDIRPLMVKSQCLHQARC